ncbi:hypothetical protein PV10_07200 [Exophiala mesophila]|uniref:Uncharacterized protein n=1 Tax=Exophiala mesophila TaxID=212818 RepID=A0A0D1WLF8_EXOME|nr:uncharacterized protein PV10_07200 [Exophiala mesophila]KIV89830.1 hypothetical protein PV10_07200 [Exophiala mesophila]
MSEFSPNQPIILSDQQPGGRWPLQQFTTPERSLPTYFEVPSKRNVITIKSANGDIVTPRDEGSRGPTLSERPETTESASENDKPNDRVSTEWPAQTNRGHPATKLNIYAPIHVPDWLLAINESVVAYVPCTPLRHFDADKYAAAFGADIHVQPRDKWPLPLGLLIPDRQTPVKPEQYQDRFIALLREELAALDQRLFYYSLYNHPIVMRDPHQLLFEIHVPGLRENSPRVDLGDIVLVRPILLNDHLVVFSQNKMWREHMQEKGQCHPAFEGREYRAVVWGLNRAKEAVLLRIENGGKVPQTANLKFILQVPKTMPLLSAVQSIHAALGSSDTTTLRSMLFPHRSDACMQTKLSAASFDIEWRDDSLNFEQQKAVAAVVADRYGTVPYLISGPPGTGKTKTIVEMALQLVARNESAVHPHLLICAPSDAAADTLALRLSLWLDRNQLFRLNSWTRSFAEVPDKLILYSYTDSHSLFSLPPFGQLMSYSIVVTTCRDANILIEARLTNKDLAELAFSTMSAVSPSTVEGLTTPLLHWTALLLDEAAQATEPESLIPLSVVLPLARLPKCQLVCPQFVLAGDEFQLGPRLESHAQRTGLEISLFQRLFNLPFYADHPLSMANGLKPLTRKLLPIPRPAFTNLTRNYRSHSAILSVPSSLFYFDNLIPEFTPLSAITTSWPGWRKPNWPVLFIQNSGPDEVDDILAGDGTGVGSLYNNDEIGIVLTRVQTLLNQIPDLQPEEVMIMSPFRAQVTRIRTALRKEGLAAVNVGPLEAFQGLESRIVMLCTTRTRRGPEGDEVKFVRIDQERGLGVIDEPKRFNMAMTRAMEGFMVVGDASTLVCTGDSSWRNFIAFCLRNGLVEGELGEIEEQIKAWDVKEGRLERALRRKELGVEENGGGVVGLRRFVENGEEEGEMMLPEG